MLKRIIIYASVLIILIGALFVGNAFLKTCKDKSAQDVILQQSQNLNNIVETNKEQSSAKNEAVSAQTAVFEKNHTFDKSSNDDLPAKVFSENKNTDNPKKADVPDDGLTCILSVNCSSVLENMHNLKENKKDIIPKDGIILKEVKVDFFPDESVFDVLQRELKNNNIHFEFVKTPTYNSVYIEGIANLYEFDCGELSGWLYKVNGIKPTYGSSQYKLSDNDKIEFFYSCNMFE